MMTDIVVKIADIVKNRNRFILASHISPDGDAVGSCLALALALKKMGKDVVVYLRDGVPYQFKYLPMAESVVTALDDHAGFDVAVVLDCAELKRVDERFAEMASPDIWVNIDHHLTNENFADISLIDREACATGYLVYQVIKSLGVEIDAAIAENIYTTIIADTGSFRYSNATSEAFQAAADMVAFGVSPWDVATKVYENQPVGRIKLLSRVLDTLEISESGGVASVVVTEQMMQETGTGPEETDGFVNYPRSLEGVDVAFMVREIGNDTYKISYRSKGTVNVAEVAKSFGGGGHKNAAGCVMQGTLTEVRKKVNDVLEQHLPKR